MVTPSRSVAEEISDAGILSAELPGDTWLVVEDAYDTAGERPLSWSPRSAVDSEGSRAALGPLAGELVLAIPYPIVWAKGEEVKCGGIGDGVGRDVTQRDQEKVGKGKIQGRSHSGELSRGLENLSSVDHGHPSFSYSGYSVPDMSKTFFLLMKA